MQGRVKLLGFTVWGLGKFRQAKFQDKAETDKPAKAPPAKATSTVGGAGPSNVPKVQGPS